MEVLLLNLLILVMRELFLSLLLLIMQGLVILDILLIIIIQVRFVLLIVRQEWL